VDSLKKLPKAVRDVLVRPGGAMADRGEAFNATDVIMTPAASRRFIRGGRIGAVWFVWYEQGGIAYSKNIVLIGADKAGALHVIATQQRGHSAALCADTERMIDGEPAAR
jgi:hypothetical protein